MNEYPGPKLNCLCIACSFRSDALKMFFEELLFRLQKILFVPFVLNSDFLHEELTILGRPTNID